MKKIIMYLLLLFHVFASFEDFKDISGHSVAVGNSTTAITFSSDGVVNNPALANDFNKKMVDLSIKSHYYNFMDIRLMQFNMGTIIPLTETHSIALSAGTFMIHSSNYLKYQENRYTFSYGYKHNKLFYMGISGLLYNWKTHTDNPQSTWAKNINVGLKYNPSNKLNIGLALNNIIGLDLANSQTIEDGIPRLITLGANYVINTRFIIMSDLDYYFKQNYFMMELGTKCIVDNFNFMLGVSYLPPIIARPTLGVTYHYKFMNITYAMSHTINLNTDHIITIGFSF